MNTNTQSLKHLREEIDSLPLSDLVTDAFRQSDKFKTSIVLISAEKLKRTISSVTDADIFSCATLHDFLRLGLNHHSCVIVVSKILAECSIEEIEKLLSKRMAKKAYSIVLYDEKHDHELLEEIKKASQEVSELSSVERVIKTGTDNVLRNFERKMTRTSFHKESNRLLEFKFSQNLIREKTYQMINEKPELFLGNAIKNIRMGSNN
jgi:hypothetical protein